MYDTVSFLEIDYEDSIPVVAKYEDKYIHKLKQIPNEYSSDIVLDNLKNNYVIEYTPLGNVLMCYNHERKTFDYYSDAIIPYRYLEPVCRKYVIMFHCKPLYVEMNVKETVVKLVEKPKSKVFAKLKNYNKPVDSKPVLLKDEINRYSYRGKINNFVTIKKVDKKLTNKRLNMTFADFKKINTLQ